MGSSFNAASSNMINSMGNRPSEPSMTPFLYAKAMILDRMNFNAIPNEALENGASALVLEINEKIVSFRETFVKTQEFSEMITVLKDLNGEMSNCVQEMFKLSKNYNSPLLKSLVSKSEEFVNPSYLVSMHSQMFIDKTSAGEVIRVPFKEDILLKIGAPIFFKDGYEDLKNKVDGITKKYSMSHLLVNDIGVGSSLNSTLDYIDSCSEDFAKRMGMPNEAVGLNGRISFGVEPNSTIYGGYFSGKDNLIMLPQNFTPSAIAHEWMHAVDYIVCSDAMNHIKKKNINNNQYEIGSSLLFKNFVSEDSRALPLDGSPELYRYAKLRSFSANILSADVYEFESKVFDKDRKIAEDFFKVGLNSTYFTLSDDVKNELLSDVGVMLVRKKVSFVNDLQAAEDIESFTLGVLKKAGVSFDEDSFAVFAYSEDDKDNKYNNVYKNLQYKFNSTKDFSLYGESDLVKNSRNYDARKNLENKISSIRNRNKPDNAGGVNTNGKDYYRSNIEVIARYLESQLYPKHVSFVNSFKPIGSEIYLDKRDENFDKFRKELLYSLVGSNKVKDMGIPEEEVSQFWSDSFQEKKIKSEKKLSALATKSFSKILGTVALVCEKIEKKRNELRFPGQDISINHSLISSNRENEKNDSIIGNGLSFKK